MYYRTLWCSSTSSLVNTSCCFVQVLLRSGRVIGAREVKVSSDRVNVDRLDIGVVSGLSVNVIKKADFPGALAVHVTKTKTLHHRYQVTVLELRFVFICSDGCHAYSLCLKITKLYSAIYSVLVCCVVDLVPIMMRISTIYSRLFSKSPIYSD